VLVLQARYVEARLQLEGLDSVSADTALLLPGSMATSLQAKTSDPALRLKLERALEAFSTKLGLLIGELRARARPGAGGAAQLANWLGCPAHQG
jgi:hypothetical protein